MKTFTGEYLKKDLLTSVVQESPRLQNVVDFFDNKDDDQIPKEKFTVVEDSVLEVLTESLKSLKD